MSIKPGTYKLNACVENPASDKRKKYEWTALPTFEVGEKFVIRAELLKDFPFSGLEEADKRPPDTVVCYSVRPIGKREWDGIRIRPDGKRWQYTLTESEDKHGVLAQQLIHSLEYVGPDRTHEDMLVNIDLARKDVALLFEAGQIWILAETLKNPGVKGSEEDHARMNHMLKLMEKLEEAKT